MFGPVYKREGGNKWGGRLGCWPFGLELASVERSIHSDALFIALLFFDKSPKYIP
jgi:hypothetical protein